MFEGKMVVLIKNRTYNKDIKFAFKLIRWLFKPIGIWTLVSFEHTSLDLILSKLSYFLCFLILPFLLLPATIHIIFVEKDVRVSLMLFGPLGFISGSFLKYICMILHKRNIKYCLKCIENDWKRVESNSPFREIMMSNVKVAHKITSFSTIFTLFAGLCYQAFLPLSKGKKFLEAENITITPLLYPGWEFFIDTNISPNHEIIYITQCFFALATLCMTSAVVSTAALFVFYISGQTQILILKLIDFIDIHDGKENISDIIDHHVKIMRFAKYSGRILREICLIEFLFSTLSICFAEYCFLVEWESGNVVGVFLYVGVWIFICVNIFILCYVGELLIDESAKIGTKVCNTKWYKLPCNKILELQMILVRSVKLPKLTAGNIADLSISTFASILKTSLTYLNLLRTVTT